MDGVTPLSLIQQGEAVRDAETILARVQKGEGLRSIGESLGMSHEGVRKWLLREVGSDYQEIQTEGLIARVVEADTMLQDAKDAVAIARAREIARFARMDLERRRPGLYGQKQHLLVESIGDLGDRLRRSQERTIDGTCTPCPNPVSPQLQAIDNKDK